MHQLAILSRTSYAADAKVVVMVVSYRRQRTLPMNVHCFDLPTVVSCATHNTQE